jgi:sugar/nucleoside kinase (ribokinase family)
MSLESALALIESVKDVNALFIGETITDEYRFCLPLSKPPKESVLAVRFRGVETYEGGILAARRHAQTLCNTAVMTVGNQIRKVRYIDENSNRKLFEVQHIQDKKPAKLLPADILARHDVAVVHDFGHGMMSKELIAQLCAAGIYLAVGTQTNAANAGFNLITKYPRADFICIDEPEARLAAADQDSSIERIMHALCRDRTRRMIVTHGRHGAYALDNGRFLHQPTFSKNIVDTMGAGDAFFAVTAPMAKTGSIEDLLLIGNAAGAVKCSILGHRDSVSKPKLIAYLNETTPR